MPARPQWRSAARLAVALAWLGVIVLSRSQPAAAPVLSFGPITAFVASLVQSLLQWTGIEALRVAAFLYVPGGFAYEITVGCTGLLPAAVLTVAILASPESRTAKRRGVLAGVPLVLVVNLVRLVHLFYLGVYAPRLFVLAHSVLWEGAIVLVTFATWLAWTRWAARSSAGA